MITPPIATLSTPKQEPGEENLLMNLKHQVLPEQRNQCIYQLIDAYAHNIPNKTAVICGGQTLTYRILNQLADQVAEHLQHLEIESGGLIGLYMDRSLAMIVGLLGIWKAGCAYVPLDSQYPKQRLEFMLAETEAAIVLTEPQLCQDLPKLSTIAQVITLKVETDGRLSLASVISSKLKPSVSTAISAPVTAKDLSPSKVEDPPSVDQCSEGRDKLSWDKRAKSSPEINPLDRLAYIIYTSGSTGKPKGVMISHRNLAHYCWSIVQPMALQSTDIYLHLASICFATSARQLLSPLSHGATVVIATSEERQIPLKVLQLAKDQQVTLMDMVPSYWRILNSTLQHLPPDTRQKLLTNTLRFVNGHGEPVPQYIPQIWQERLQHPAATLNLYGQAEATGSVAFCFYQSGEPGAVMPIGQPLPGMKLYILDDNLTPVAPGTCGEIYVGGPAVSQGYFKRPELNDERFIVNPLINHKSGNSEQELDQTVPFYLYKTGDLGRCRSDGVFEMLGRVDRQVKINGVRVEIDEIEAILSQHPTVREAAVLDLKTNLNEPYLVAYLTLEPTSLSREDNNWEQIEIALQTVRSGKSVKIDSLTVAESNSELIHQLKTYLQAQVSRYVVPSKFVILEDLPLTPNGKVDRKVLLAQQEAQFENRELIAPRTETEVKLAKIWCDILNLTQISLDDNFFELGGHSLLATQVISRIRDVFFIELPLAQVFAYPTLMELAQSIDTIQPTDSIKLTTISSVPKDTKVPLSFAQQRLWFLDQLEGPSSTYNISNVWQLEGDLNLSVLTQSLQTIVQRHEGLRTIFPSDNAAPYQKIQLDVTVQVPLIDLQSLPPTELESQIQILINAEAQTPFVLAQDTLVRCKLLKCSTTVHVLVITIHHIVADDWSLGIFQQELSELYTAFCQSEPLPLAPLPIQYADFAYWQHQWLQGQVLETLLDYWRNQLADSPPLLDLPTDYPRPAKQVFRGSTIEFDLDAHLTQKLQLLSQQSGTTLFISLLSAFSILLCRYSNSTDIVVGSPIANRNRQEIEPLIGFFVNTLVLRNNLEGNPSFLELLQRTRQVALNAYAHQDLPFEKLVEELNPDRNLSYHPLVQVMFVLQNSIPSHALSFPGVTVSPRRVERTTAKFDLILSMREASQGLQGVWEYNSDLFTSNTIQRLHHHFQTLLKGIVANPDQLISELPLLTEAEQQQLLAQWSQAHRDYPGDSSIHHLFEQQVERTPDAVALVFGEQQLSYRELDRRANQLATYLQTLGVEREVLVGLCLERSPELIVAMLGTLKAGGAYVPLDSNYPSERLAFILNETQIPVLITQTTLRSRLANYEQCVLICLDEIDLTQSNGLQSYEVQSDSSSEPQLVTRESLAYVIYTSGSTGQPKGVSIPHQAVIRLAIDPNYVTICSDDTCLQLASIAFDAATFEVWGALLNGAKLVLAPAARPSLAEIAHLLSHHQITVVWLTSGLFHQMVEEHLESFTSVRQLLAGGDVLSVTHVKKAVRALPNTLVINGYGPTENTTFTCCYPIRNLEAIGTSVPIGCAISNTQVYLLDDSYHPVPIGVSGELYIGGDGLAREYFNRPNLTAERFICHPALGRLYKTGDLCRYRSDGNLEFIGRIDHQVKIRGFRIELGEIETVLGEHPDLQAVVVLAREDNPGDKRLVAYFVVEADKQILPNQLQQFLKQRLPDYMIPSAFVQLRTLPLTLNGKVDRRSLPIPDFSQLPHRLEFTAPQTETEYRIVKIWSEVMKCDRISIHDNFFELGGHSLLATRVISKLRQTLQIELPIQSLFEYPTVAGWAKHIDLVLWFGRDAVDLAAVKNTEEIEI
ncbi:MAG: amino acid adenylation domain-containing protein [Moorea sp. SIO3I7]|uniref:non-ribosomal peptide synthetase n=1 Tax=unclassified Moorena TaxID=2683338 RepID=UPI0013BF1A5D|nr:MULTISPECIES: non-ribosomal peptide synthetase [unclassified Moorena]NEN94395.1 amino acid adenylation domain-containing protein [Moorena sp. SIO3I7]NEO06711.1 amino acid adenylation domain-containing protein [Moorena sp. SIO3I8]NEO20278.1 amino acid adenylation domain-containing protein [Moorena sp. SIO4A5]NEQ60216.1 amino acid adenylation domain-containing protein [Moorena sp. SIO4A1]